MTLITTLLVSGRAQKYTCNTSMENSARFLTSTTQDTIETQLQKRFDGLTKGFTGVVKGKGGRHILPRSKKDRNSREQ